MPAPIPATHRYIEGAGYFRQTDLAGPYTFDGASTFTLMASTGTPIAVSSVFEFRPGVGWFNGATGAGPYVFNGTQMTPMA